MARSSDSLFGDANDDLIYGDDVAGTNTLGGADTVDGGTGNDTIYGGFGADSLNGGAGNNFLYGGDGSDSLAAGTGNDWMEGGAGDDTIFGDGGNDTLFGDAGNDALSGDTGNDSLGGDAGDDSVFGGDGNDTTSGGAGNDILFGGAGADSMTGGLGNDTFAGTFQGGDVIIGGEDPGDGDIDVLDLTALGVRGIDYSIVYGGGNNEAGTVSILTGPNVGQTFTFSEIETIPCFMRGTTITTFNGEVMVELLQQGDLVLTRDHGFQPVRWIGKARLEARI